MRLLKQDSSKFYEQKTIYEKLTPKKTTEKCTKRLLNVVVKLNTFSFWFKRIFILKRNTKLVYLISVHFSRKDDVLRVRCGQGWIYLQALVFSFILFNLPKSYTSVT